VVGPTAAEVADISLGYLESRGDTKARGMYHCKLGSSVDEP